jgi:DNA-binding YbaB/EbfC family protein
MNIPGMGNMLKQMQKMQEDMKKNEEELAQLEITGKAGVDLVEITLDGHKNCKKARLNPSLKGEDFDIIEDLIVAAFNAASQKVDAVRAEKTSDLTSGFKLPAGLDSLLK